MNIEVVGFLTVLVALVALIGIAGLPRPKPEDQLVTEEELEAARATHAELLLRVVNLHEEVARLKAQLEEAEKRPLG